MINDLMTSHSNSCHIRRPQGVLFINKLATVIDMKKGSVIAFIALLSAFSVLFVGSASSQGSVAKLTAEKWQEDVRYLGSELPKRHRNAFHRLKREDFEAAVDDLYN